MVPRLAVGAFLLTITISACQSSGRYGAPPYAAAVVGAGVAGAAVSRAVGGCFAECVAGTRCNHATGLCESESIPTAAVTPVAVKASGARPPPRVSSVSYAPGHEYDVPPASMSVADAGCEPVDGRHGGSLACEMDASATQSQ